MTGVTEDYQRLQEGTFRCHVLSWLAVVLQQMRRQLFAGRQMIMTNGQNQETQAGHSTRYFHFFVALKEIWILMTSGTDRTAPCLLEDIPMMN